MVSWGYECGWPSKYPTVFTDVVHHAEWIESTMATFDQVDCIEGRKIYN